MREQCPIIGVGMDLAYTYGGSDELLGIAPAQDNASA
jgi:hypothetical protein